MRYVPGPTLLLSSTSLLILQMSPDGSYSSFVPSMIGVRKREGMLGTDIFCRLGLLMAALARPGATGLTTVSGLITIEGLLFIFGLPWFGEAS